MCNLGEIVSNSNEYVRYDSASGNVLKIGTIRHYMVAMK